MISRVTTNDVSEKPTAVDYEDQEVRLLRILDFLNRRRHVPSKRRASIALLFNVTSQKTRYLNIGPVWKTHISRVSWFTLKILYRLLKDISRSVDRPLSRITNGFACRWRGRCL